MQWTSAKNLLCLVPLTFLFSQISFASSQNPASKQTETKDLLNLNLVLIENNEGTGDWGNLPGTIEAGEIDQVILNPDGSGDPVTGSATYGVAEYCENMGGNYFCDDPAYTFTVNILNTSCTVNNGGYLTVTVSYIVIDTQLECEVNAVLQPQAGSPQITLSIENQTSSKINSANYTYALLDGRTDIEEGLFKPAQPADIPAQQTAFPTTLTALYGPSSPYDGTVQYEFDDYINGGVPTGLQIDMDNSSGNQQDWCSAQITGLNYGCNYYSATTEYVGNNEFGYCVVTVKATPQPTCPDGDFGFSPVDTLETQGINQWEVFNIAGTTYLAAANATAQSPDYPTANFFYFDTNQQAFVPTENNPLIVGYICVNGAGDYQLRDHVYSWRHFKVGGVDRIIMANHYSYGMGSDWVCTSTKNYWTNSYMFQWNSDLLAFDIDQGVQSIAADAATVWESYYNSTGDYLITVGDNPDTGISSITAFKWNGSSFDKMAQQNDLNYLNHPSNVQTFTNNANQTYAVVTQSGKTQEGGTSYDTYLYYVTTAAENPGYLSLQQGSAANLPGLPLIAPEGMTQQALVFNANGEFFLILAYTPEAANNNQIQPYLYRLEYVNEFGRYLFVKYQALPQNFVQVQSWDYVTYGSYSFLAAATGGPTANAYIWNPGTPGVPDTQGLETDYPLRLWPPEGTSPSFNIYSVTGFNIGSNAYFALAAYGSNPLTEQIQSPIVQWQLLSSEK